jgi:ABC-type branched-subunit amino acid transport system permease subunit
MFGTIGQRTGARPLWLGLDGDVGYFYLCAAVAAAAIGIVLLIRRTRLGRLLNALADSPVALSTHGSSTTVTRLLVFCISAALASMGGALLVGVVGSISVSGVSPSALVPFNSLLWLAALVLAGRHPILGPVLAAVALIVVPSWVSAANAAQYVTIAFGAAALLVALFGESFSAWLAVQEPSARARRSLSPTAARLAMAHPESRHA